MLLAFHQKYRNTSKHQHCHQFLCSVLCLNWLKVLVLRLRPRRQTKKVQESMRYCEPRRTVELRTTTGLGGLLEISAPRYKASTWGTVCRLAVVKGITKT